MIHWPLLLPLTRRYMIRILATHIYLPLVHGYTNARHVAFHIIVIIVTWMLNTLLSHVHTSLLHMLTTWVYMHILFLTDYHMTHRACYTDYCSMLSYPCYMIVSCYWYRFPVTGHESCWYAICGIPHLLFSLYCSRYIVPVILFLVLVILFYAINRAQVQLLCYPYHVQ